MHAIPWIADAQQAGATPRRSAAAPNRRRRRGSLGPASSRHRFGQSLSASLASTVISLVVGGPAAYVLARWRFRGQHQVAMWILVTRVAPPIAFTIPFFLAYTWLGLMDTVAGPR